MVMSSPRESKHAWKKLMVVKETTIFSELVILQVALVDLLVSSITTVLVDYDAIVVAAMVHGSQ